MVTLNTLNPTVGLNESPAVILVRPQLGENIGAVARAMLNFGWSDLRIVCPRDGWPNQSAVAMASGAGSILDNAKICESTDAACIDLKYVFATTARNRDLSKEICSPERAMQKSIMLINSGQRVGVMFGPERAGLENSDIYLAQEIVSFPINPKFSSLNLAQCVILMAYEWFKTNSRKDILSAPDEKIYYAARIEVEHLRLALLKNLHSVNYFWPESKKESLTKNLNNLLGRLPLTSSDVRTLHGVIKALIKPSAED
jgi:tRNA/rRNA methyltransferase